MAANKDFRVAVGFSDHPKIIKLYSKFGGDGVFALFRLWEYAAKWRTDGALNGDDRETLQIACGLRSTEGFIEQLVLLRLVDIVDGEGARREFKSVGEVSEALDKLLEEGLVLVVHDWDEHNPYAAKARERSERGRANAAKRYESRTASGTANSSGSGKASGGAAGGARGWADGSAPPPLPAPTPAPSPAYAGSAPGQVPEQQDGDTAFIEIPTNRNGEVFTVTNRMVSEWSALYPAVDVPQELRNILGWNNANKKRRKTYDGVERHIDGWIRDRQNKSKNGVGAQIKTKGWSEAALAHAK